MPSDDFDEDNERDWSVFRWHEIETDPIPENAPSWRIFPFVNSPLSIRAQVSEQTFITIAGSDRWFLVSRRVERLFDESGEVADFSELYPNEIVCFYEENDSGDKYLAPPGRVVMTAEADDGGAQMVLTLHDHMFDGIIIDYLPYPLDAICTSNGASVILGPAQQEFVRLWGLDVFCPECTAVGVRKRKGKYKCPNCKVIWPRPVSPQVMADPDNHHHFASWTLPIERVLQCLAKAGWQRSPFEVSWKWGQGVHLATTYRRGDEVIELDFDPTGVILDLTGPNRFRESVCLDIREAPSVCAQLLDEEIPWALKR